MENAMAAFGFLLIMLLHLPPHRAFSVSTALVLSLSLSVFFM